MRLSRSTAVVLGLLAAVDCGAAYLLLRPRLVTAPQGPTEIYPHVNASRTYRVDPAWPVASASVEPGEITGVAVDRDSRVWVLGLCRPPVRLYDAQGNFLRGWGTGELVFGHQLRLDREGNVWVVDGLQHCVHKFAPEGRRLLTIGTPGEAGEDATHFNQPTDVAITADGDIFVADGYINARVAHFRGDGRFVKAWGSRGSRPGQFSLVHAIAADSRGRLLVADRNNARIQLFDKQGQFLGQWCNIVVPWGLWVTPEDDVWVCGSSPAGWRDNDFALATPPHDQLLVRFDRDGRVRQLWSVPVGDRPGQLNWVHAIAADVDGNLYCGDYRGKRVQKFVNVPPTDGTQP